MSPISKGRCTRADKLNLSVQYGTLLVQYSVVFNATDKINSVRVIKIVSLMRPFDMANYLNKKYSELYK